MRRSDQIGGRLGRASQRRRAIFARNDSLRALSRRFFDRPDELVLGSETAEQACERFAASIENAILTGQKDIIVVTHGTVISLFIASVAQVDPMSLWQQLGLPSYVVLTVPSLKIQTTVASVTVPVDAD